ncbi:MAG: LamG domain-containing protein, partial [Clostridiaceae bacterium]|nr:LamG domain-containing protein [Clostridiaceae bacterium]
MNTEAGSKTVKAEKVVDDTGWHHYTITYDGSAIIAYVDGIERARADLSGRIGRDASRAVVIGRNPWGDSFEGLMDDFRIYDRALSANEIRTVIGGGTVGPGMAEELESLF